MMSEHTPVVLVIDDDEAIRQGAQAVLELVADYPVLSADNGRAGAQVFAEHADEIGVVLLDLTMPVMGGQETLQEILAIRPDARVVLISGYPEKEAVRNFAGLGLTGFLQKPFSMEGLIAKVKEVLALP